jgi:hypothetical protein
MNKETKDHINSLVPDLPIGQPKKKVFKPGIDFESTVPNLCRRYTDIETVFKHMTMGQLSHHSEKDDCIFHDKKGLIYNSKTGEVID